MLYLYSNAPGNTQASVVYDGNTLTDEQKAQAVQVESLPIDESTENQVAILHCDKATETAWYTYEVKPVNLSEGALQDIELMKQAINDLIFLGGM